MYSKGSSRAKANKASCKNEVHIDDRVLVPKIFSKETIEGCPPVLQNSLFQPSQLVWGEFRVEGCCGSPLRLLHPCCHLHHTADHPGGRAILFLCGFQGLCLYKLGRPNCRRQDLLRVLFRKDYMECFHVFEVSDKSKFRPCNLTYRREGAGGIDFTLHFPA